MQSVVFLTRGGTLPRGVSLWRIGAVFVLLVLRILRLRGLVLALIGALFLTACGFEPLYKESAASRDLNGQIAIPEKNSRDDFELREALLLRLGGAGARFTMSYDLRVIEERLVVVGSTDAVRFLLTGFLDYQITDAATGGEVFADSQFNTVSYSATGATFPTRRAKESATTRLIEGLAEQTHGRLALTAKDWLQ